MAFVSDGEECNRRVQIQSPTCQSDNAECARVPRLLLSFDSLFVPPLFGKTEATLNYLITCRSSFTVLPFLCKKIATVVFIRHTFKAEMSYLNTKRKSICHHRCHHWSALKSGVDLPRLKRPSLCVPDPPPTHTQLVTSVTARQTIFFLTFFLMRASQPRSCTNFSPCLLLCARETFFFLVVSFWRRLGVGEMRLG